MDLPTKRVLMLIYDGCDLLDFAGPVEVFHSAARHLVRIGTTDELRYVVEPVSIAGGPVRTRQGVIVETAKASELAPGSCDTLIVVGGEDDHRTCDPELLEWVRRSYPSVRRLASVCCGAFLVGGTGLLNGRRATTHWEDCDRLQKDFPDIEVCPDAIYLNDGNIWTSAGISSGIDMALAMVEEDHGHGLALLVARNLVVYHKRPGGQSQFSSLLQSQAIEGQLSQLLVWVIENPHEDLRTEKLAERANMSLRNFYRAFEAATGTSPAEWVEMARSEIAKRYLEQGADKVEQVAFKAGFSNYEQMRKVFARRAGISPSQYRSRFARAGGVKCEPTTFTRFFDRYIAHEMVPDSTADAGRTLFRENPAGPVQPLVHRTTYRQASR